MRLLGIDYGLKNTGLALGVSRGVTLPLKTIHTTDKETLISEIKKVCFDERINLIVVGIPDYADSTQKELTLAFVQELENVLDIPVETVNEFGTSKEAFSEEYVKHSRLKKLKKKIHARSAERILDNYWLSFGEETFNK